MIYKSSVGGQLLETYFYLNVYTQIQEIKQNRNKIYHPFSLNKESKLI